MTQIAKIKAKTFILSCVITMVESEVRLKLEKHIKDSMHFYCGAMSKTVLSILFSELTFFAYTIWFLSCNSCMAGLS